MEFDREALFDWRPAAILGMIAATMAAISLVFRPWGLRPSGGLNTADALAITLVTLSVLLAWIGRRDLQAFWFQISVGICYLAAALFTLFIGWDALDIGNRATMPRIGWVMIFLIGFAGVGLSPESNRKNLV